MQLSYAEQAKGFDGMLADMGPKEVISRAAEGAVPFGKFVVLGTDKDNQAKLPAASGDIVAQKVLGVSLHDHARESQNDGLAAGYLTKESMSILKKGMVYVTAEEAVTPSDTVYVRHTVNGALTVGSVRKDADTDKAVALAGLRFMSSAGAGELVKLSVDL